MFETCEFCGKGVLSLADPRLEVWIELIGGPLMAMLAKGRKLEGSLVG